jgi:YidC/Oxa1 family membrane protein insertase
MDTRRLLIAMLITIPIVMLWPSIVTWVGRQMGYDMSPRPATTQPVADSTTPPSLTSPVPGNIPVEPSTTGPVDAGVALRPTTRPSEPGTITIGSAEPKNAAYAMEVTFSTRGAGIESIRLNDFKTATDNEARYTFQTPYKGFEDLSRPLASSYVVLSEPGGTSATIPLHNLNWNVVRHDAGSAVFAVELNDGAGGHVRFTKTFQIAQREAAKDTHRGYEIAVSLGFENLGTRPYTLKTAFNGPVMPPHELDRGYDRNVIGGYLHESGRLAEIRHDPLESFGESKPKIDYTKGADDIPLLWAGTSSVYFNAALRPDPVDSLPGTNPLSPGYIGAVEARALDVTNPVTADRKVITFFETKDLSLQPGASITLPLRVFTGPRLRSLLNNDYLASLPFDYDETLVLTSGPCAWCTFQWLVNVLVWLLGIFHFVLRDWGLAIIVLVLVVRALLHPITKKSQVNMMKMSKFGPELEKIKSKFKDDPAEQQRAIMQFYKEHGATPILGCLPMLLQMPIWIALFSALQSTFELRQAPFLQFGNIKLTWIDDLSQPDHLIKFDNTYSFFFIVISGLNVLPFLLAVVFFLQHKFTPKPPTMTPEQEQQQKIMQWMTLLFPIFLYGGPSGLNLYILASTTFGIIESKIIRDHVKQREEEEKAGAVIIDAPPPPRRGKQREPDPPPPAAPKGWWARKMEEARKKVEELQRQAEQQQKKKRTP